LLAQQDNNTPSVPLHQQVSRPQRPALPDSELNSRFTFDRFIANANNHMTYEAALAVSERPGIYNPFLVYGGVGLGKTHLLHAIAHVLQKKGLRIIYISSEAFTNDLIDAIRNRSTAMFRDKYRSVDALLVDDIQFIGGKESTEQEFFHTFNALATFNKQIILASDRHPSQLAKLQDRLRSRFEGGLVMDVQPPEYETRMAILEMWAGEHRINLPSAVCEMIAGRAQNNIRELEGIFNQIVAKAQLGAYAPTPIDAEITLNHYHNPREHITLRQVVDITADIYHVKSTDIVGKRRTQRVNQARQVAMYLARELTEASLPQIGEGLGGRSHTTVLHGCNKIADEIAFDPRLNGIVEQIRSKLEKRA
jgi:chromosomal replication initiator protein